MPRTLMIFLPSCALCLQQRPVKSAALHRLWLQLLWMLLLQLQSLPCPYRASLCS